jgi:hypothetical protein
MISNAIPIFKEFTDSDFESYVEKITKKHIAFIKKGE